MDEVGLMRSAVRGEEREGVSVHVWRKANVLVTVHVGTIAVHTHTCTHTHTHTCTHTHTRTHTHHTHISTAGSCCGRRHMLPTCS